ncbi:MAG: tetratricopeptide repeat protein [Planctomycetota bacterium]
MFRFLCIAWVSILLVAACQKDESKPGTPFDGRDLVIAGRYSEAILALEHDLERDPRSPRASRAWLFLGKAHLALGNLEDAESAFRSAVREFPSSLEAHKSQYKLALIALIRGDREAARRGFEALAQSPDGPLAAEATAMARHLE